MVLSLSEIHWIRPDWNLTFEWPAAVLKQTTRRPLLSKYYAETWFNAAVLVLLLEIKMINIREG